MPRGYRHIQDYEKEILELRSQGKTGREICEKFGFSKKQYTNFITRYNRRQDKIAAGQPVVDDAGVVGQVTRVFPYVSEVTLVTDKDQAIPVQNVRTGLRSVVFGLGNGQLELRFMPANADVQNGDLLVTSGLDGIFLSGFPVAKVVHIERDTSYSFARIYCAPLAGVENFSEVMVLDPKEPTALPNQLMMEAATTAATKPSSALGAKKKRLKRE